MVGDIGKWRVVGWGEEVGRERRRWAGKDGEGRRRNHEYTK